MSALFPVTEDHFLCMCCKLATYFNKEHKETDRVCCSVSVDWSGDLATKKKNRSSKAKGEKGFSQPLQYLCQGVLSS